MPEKYHSFITTVTYNKLHPDERNGTKDIVEEVCEYYIEIFENADRPKRRNRSASSAGVDDEYKIMIGKRRKCEAENCSVCTESYCSLCKIFAKNTNKFFFLRRNTTTCESRAY